MVSAKDCLRHAARCKYMATISRDPGSKSNWGRMSKRWIERAGMVEEQKQYRRCRARATMPLARARRHATPVGSHRQGSAHVTQ
jgi:hypothetical protein